MRQLPDEVQFGVEIECHARVEEISLAGDGWQQVGDSSLSPCGRCQQQACGHQHTASCVGGLVWDYICGHRVLRPDCPHPEHQRPHRPVEYRTPILYGEAGLQRLADGTHQIAAAAHVAADCGLHVHLDVRAICRLAGLPMSFSRSYLPLMNRARALYGAVLPALEPMLARRRVNSRWAVTSWLPQQVSAENSGQLSDLNRYQAVNIAAFPLHGTVEFRQHQGSVEARRVTDWVRFCANLMLATAQDKELRYADIATPQSLLAWLDVSAPRLVARVRRSALRPLRQAAGLEVRVPKLAEAVAAAEAETNRPMDLPPGYPLVAACQCVQCVARWVQEHGCRCSACVVLRIGSAFVRPVCICPACLELAVGGSRLHSQPYNNALRLAQSAPVEVD